MKDRDVPISLAQTVNMIGDPWTLHILKESFLGIRQFQEFQTRLGIPRQTLILRLRQLVSDQIFYKKPVQHRRLIFEYRLTPKGTDLYAMILAIWEWHKRWSEIPRNLPEQLFHVSCNHPTSPIMVCRQCANPLTADSVSLTARLPQKEIPAPTTRRKRIVNQFQSKGVEDMVAVIVGDGWSLLVLNAIISNMTTFDSLQRALDISNNVLATRLKILMSLNLLTQTQSTIDKRVFHYETTPMGDDVYPIIVSLIQWGDRWLAGDDGPADIIKHDQCGSIDGFVTVCSHCNDRLNMVDVRLGPAKA